MSGRRIVVTGGLGLIGRAITEQWLAMAGPERTACAIDDARTGPLTPPPWWAWVRESVETVADGAPTLALNDAAVVHCAAPVGPVGILAGNVLTEMLSSVTAAITIARKSGAPLVLFSSSEVHGRERPEPDGSCVVHAGWSPRQEYAVGKIATELMAARHHHETGLPTAVIRPWNITGPAQDAGKGFVIPRWAQAIMAGKPITVYGDGSAERAIMAVSDLARLVVELIDSPTANGWDARPLEAAAPQNATTMIGLAELMVQGAGAPRSLIAHVDPRELHGELFAEAASGSKLPPASPDLRGWTDLEDIIGSALEAAQGNLAA